ncbi:hypothetical protein OHA72_23520 [Dactylosporangium sp. NBC_01737]|uniref:hypothetical protein n=1 Tax=Dactylosporangium sp. NBC_01737 TaxID=2975959 RepID=UPI002E164967|nr:hypothetical protein OHA72_23520 [Dactylosporangium sp. NBC_01737]
MAGSEDVFEVPAAWGRHVVPRRGGPGPALRVAAAVDADLAEDLGKALRRLPGVAGHAGTPADIAAAVRLVAAGPAESGGAPPLGVAAVMAALPRHAGRTPQAAYDSLVDVWVTGSGVRHVARIVAAVAGVYAGADRTGATSFVAHAEPAGPVRRSCATSGCGSPCGCGRTSPPPATTSTAPSSPTSPPCATTRARCGG